MKGVRQKVHVISSEKHAAEASDDVQLLLVLILPVGLPVLLAGDVPAQDVHQNLAGLAAVDHVLLQPAGRLLPGPVLADLLRVIQRFQRLLPDDLQGHGVPEGLGVLLADQGGQSALHMLDIVIRLEILGAGGLPQVDPLAQARVQVDGVHDAVPALQDGGHLHIPLAALQLLPDPVLGVLEGQHHVPLTVPLLGEAGVDGDIAVQVAVAGPLAEELHPGNFPLPGPAEALQGEVLAEGVQILPVELGLQLGAQGFLPVHQLAAVDAMHLPVDPDGVRQAGVQVDHIDGVVLLPQGADDLLAPDIALLPLQALPEHIVHVLGAQQGQLLPVGVPEVAHRLQQQTQRRKVQLRMLFPARRPSRRWSSRTKARTRSTSSGCSRPFRMNRSSQSDRGSGRLRAQSSPPSRMTS